MTAKAPKTGGEPRAQGKRLEGWGAIATYLKVSEKTASRYESREGMPVHRHQHLAGPSVYAIESEIDTWRATRRVAAAPLVRQSPSDEPRQGDVKATVAEAADATRLAVHAAERRSHLLWSTSGVEAAQLAFRRICAGLKRACAETAGLIDYGETSDSGVTIQGGGQRFTLELHIPDSQRLSGSMLVIAEWQVAIVGMCFEERPVIRRTTAYAPDFGPAGEFLWRKHDDGDDETVSSTELAEASVIDLLRRIRVGS